MTVYHILLEMSSYIGMERVPELRASLPPQKQDRENMARVLVSHAYAETKLTDEIMKLSYDDVVILETQLKYLAYRSLAWDDLMTGVYSNEDKAS